MKKLIYLLPVLALFFTACDPMDEIYADIDAQENIVVGDAEYTLTDDDYEALGLNYGSFSSEDDAKAAIPSFLTDMYPVWGKGSSVLLGYQLYIGNAFKISEYNLEQADYTLSGSDLLGFQADATPENYLADFLADNISSPSEGDYAFAKYFQFTGDAYTVTPTVSLEENFDYGSVGGDLTTISGGVWVNHSGTANQLLYDASSLSMTDYPSSDVGGSMLISSSGSEDVNNEFTPITSGKAYASTLINLSTVDSGTYFFHFMDDSYGYSARVGAMDNGSGKIVFGIGATSSSLTYGTTAFDLNTTYLLVASYDIASGTSNLYVLTTVAANEPATPEATNTGDANKGIQKIGVRQGGGGPTATLDGIRVANTWSSIMSNDELADEVIGDKEAKETAYTYDGGAWEISTGVYSLTSEDYDAMGTASGQPGRYNNFDSSMNIENYISTFLGIKYPFALDGDTLDIMYKYYSSSAGATQTRGNRYTVVNGAWVAYQSTISTTLQFGHDGNAWVPDNTIKYTLVAADYQYMADQLTGNSDFDNVSLPNLASYGDFDYNWTQDQIVQALGILADYLNPTAEEGQKYVFTYLLYDNGLNTLSTNIILTNGVWVLNN